MDLAKAEETHEAERVLLKNEGVANPGDPAATKDKTILNNFRPLPYGLWLVEHLSLHEVSTAADMVGEVEVPSHQTCDTFCDGAGHP